jgi:signal transduction histidine kinase/pSer/pThr/pTyr-binding forkhead associated (FHA) protein
VLEVIRGNLAEKIYFLRPRSYTVGRGRHNDLALAEPSISKAHSRIVYEDGRFVIEDQGSLHGVYVNAAKVERAELSSGSQIQLGNVTLKFSLLGSEGTTDQMAEFPWVEHQQLLLQLVQTLNSTLVLSQVLDQVLGAVMRISRAERGFLLLADNSAEAAQYPQVAGLRMRVARRRDGSAPLAEVQGISTSVVRKAIESGETVATGNAAADPSLQTAQSVIMMDLRTIVCIPLRSPRAEVDGNGGYPRGLGALYVDNQETSAPFPPDSLRAAEALARHAALAIENAQLFEREQRTIEELRKAQSQLLQSEKLATIGQMAAGIAHELNTPLTYIMGNLELIQAQEFSDSSKDMLDSIARGAERIKSLAQSLLAFSRPSQEELTPLVTNDVIERSLELCHYQILKGGVRLEKNLDTALPKIMGVSNQLEMALINLVVNAIQAMNGGGTLRVASGTNGEDVEISVTDTGPGIPEEIRSSVFEPFVTTKPEGKGTGLGLSTVLMVVERHQGRVDFTTNVGDGTTFRILLPAAR